MKINTENADTIGIVLDLDHGDLDKHWIIIQNLLAIPNLAEVHFHNIDGREAMKIRNCISRFVEISDFYDMDIKIRRKELNND